MNKSSLVLTVSLLTIGTFALTGCGQNVADKIAENAVEKIVENEIGGGVDVDLSGDQINYKTGDSSFQAGTNVKLPSNFPTDIYKIEGNVISAISDAKKDTYWVMIESMVSAEDAGTAYQTDLEKNGWTITSNANFNGLISLAAEKGKRDLAIMIAGDADTGKTSVTISGSTKVSE